jgi:uncharacterized protein YdhG (YjbR/CyaY superfamily)
MKPVKTVDDYIDQSPKHTQTALKHLRTLIKSRVPEAEEKISYQIPLYTLNKKHLIGFAAFKDHCSIFVINSSIFEDFKKELADHKGAKTTIHFDPKNPLPDSLITKIIQVRVAEVTKTG